MPEPIHHDNGLVERVRSHGESINRLWSEKASKERVDHLEKDLIDTRDEMKEEVKGLRRVLIGVAGAWLFGTCMFLIAALEFAGR